MFWDSFAVKEGEGARSERRETGFIRRRNPSMSKAQGCERGR
jgi:hypothetical protein